MAYEKQTWVCGETITADKLNHIENGIDECCSGGGGASPKAFFYVEVEKNISLSANGTARYILNADGGTENYYLWDADNNQYTPTTYDDFASYMMRTSSVETDASGKIGGMLSGNSVFLVNGINIGVSISHIYITTVVW